MHEHSLVSIFLPAVIIWCLLEDSSSERFKVIFFLWFWFTFPSSLVIFSIYLPTGYFTSSLEKCPLGPLPICNLTFSVFDIDLYEFIVYFYINLLLDTDTIQEHMSQLHAGKSTGMKQFCATVWEIFLWGISRCNTSKHIMIETECSLPASSFSNPLGSNLSPELLKITGLELTISRRGREWETSSN